MKRLKWLALVLILSCAKVLPVYQIPEIVVGEPSFFPTIEAYTDAPDRRRKSHRPPVQRR